MSTIKKTQILLFFCFVFSLTKQSRAQELFSNLKATAALDLVTPLYTSEEDDRAFNMQVRSAEFMLYSPIDHLFDGVINFAGHTENGSFELELHEGYLSSSKLIPHSRFKAGKFFLGVGRLNQYHQHDWYFTSAPKAHEIFFAEEAAADTGFEYTLLFPSNHFFEITLGLTRNYCYGHCHNDTGKPSRPLFYVHPVTFFEFSPQSGLQLGLSYLNRIDHQQVQTQLAGFDLTFKQRQGKRLKWLFQTEAYFEERAASSIENSQKVGGYHYTQYGINPSWSLGLRFDTFSELSKKFQSTKEKQNDFDYALVPNLTWKASEFSTLRLSYTYDVDTTEGESDKTDHLAQIQLSFILGAHPAHDF